MDTIAVGQLIAKKRREAGLSQEALATQVEISRVYLSQIERGEAANISTSVLQKTASALAISASDLMNAHDKVDTLIPPSLRQFGTEKKLAFDVIDRLARLPHRGKAPDTVKGWEELYKQVKKWIEA